jgi:hypothetical protein
MTDGAWNDDLEVLVLDQLHNNQALIAAFSANPANALAPFELTAHEEHAFVTKDVDAFVALGVVDSVSELPPVLTGASPGGGRPGILDRVRAEAGRLVRVIDRVPRPPIRLPIPRPRPGTPPGPPPGPGPFPGPPGPDPPRPGPGPDPPDPDRPGGG